MRRSSPLPLALFAAFAIGALLAAGCGDDDTTRSNQAADAAARAGLGKDVQQFLALAASSPKASYRVAYAPSESGVRVIVTQDPPRRRVDLVRGAGAEAVVESRIANDDGGFVCRRAPGTSWQCEQTQNPVAAPTAFAAADVDATARRLREQQRTYDFAVEHRRVADVNATCLVTCPKHPAVGRRTETLCVSSRGVPLLLDQEGTTLRAEDYGDEAPASAFRLPAPAKG